MAVTLTSSVALRAVAAGATKAASRASSMRAVANIARNPLLIKSTKFQSGNSGLRIFALREPNCVRARIW
eukprot:2429780-Pyramimonas_sp.AAC.1